MDAPGSREEKDPFRDLSVEEIIRKLDEFPIEAAYALGSLGSRQAVGPLIGKLVYPPDDSVWDNLNNLAIAWALGTIRDREAVSPLVRLLKSRSGDVRTVAAWGLGQIGDRAAVPALVEALRAAEQGGVQEEDPSLCEGTGTENPAARTIIPHIVSTCSLRKGSPVRQALRKLGYTGRQGTAGQAPTVKGPKNTG